MPPAIPAFPEANLIGTAFLTLTSLLAAYLLVLKIRDHLSEKPDPKLTYATRNELERMQQSLNNLTTETRQEIAATHTLIHRNAEHIASILAQSRMNHQRLTELGVKTDRLLERISHNINS